MIRELTIRESYDWLRSTLEQVSSIPRLGEEDFAYIVFEVLDADVRSGLGEVALDRLVSVHAISEAVKGEIQTLRMDFVTLVDSAQERRSQPTAQIRGWDGWHRVARRSEQIILEHFSDGAA